MTNYLSNNTHYYDQLKQPCLDSTHAIGAAAVFRRVYEFDEDETTVMDFACGVGLVSQELMPYAKSIVGIDISQKMVDEYNRRVANQGLSSEEMHAVRADVLSSSCEELRRMKGSFDVVVCSASYHHLDDIVSTTQALGCFLKPGGSLLVIDLLKDQNLNVDEIFPEHERHDIVAHRGGFSQHEIKEAFDAAGLSSFVFTDGIKAKKSGQPVTLFIARGVLKQP